MKLGKPMCFPVLIPFNFFAASGIESKLFNNERSFDTVIVTRN